MAETPFTLLTRAKQSDQANVLIFQLVGFSNQAGRSCGMPRRIAGGMRSHWPRAAGFGHRANQTTTDTSSLTAPIILPVPLAVVSCFFPIR